MLLEVTLSSLSICWGLIGSIPISVFPAEATNRGISAELFGPVFSMFHLAILSTSALMATWSRTFGIGRLFAIGLILTCLSSLLFGLLTFIPTTSPSIFLISAYCLRLVEGVGGAALWTSNLTLLMEKYPESPGRAYALLETSYGLGYMAGPTISGFLYEAEGFLLPYLVCGIAIALIGLLSAFTVSFPSRLVENSEGNKEYTMRKLVFMPGVIAGLLSSTVAAISIGYSESLLEVHLKQFLMSPRSVGLTYLFYAISYIFASPVIGSLNDKIQSPWSICTAGLVTILLSLVLFGPAPYVPLAPSIYLTGASLTIQGLGIATVLVSSYCLVLSTALDHGYPDSLDTYSIVSGLWTSAFALGNVLGPVFAGFLFDEIGFSWGTVVVQGVIILGIIFNLCVKLFCKSNHNLYESIPSSPEQ